ncbi:hypothetical protein FUA23_01700 [Neolewinella aurantiaca]|uniref:Gliding motility-associated protein GldM first immunoglobulin-like domain-containing protein n=1 Tax=Neolewinella aurantiaca TaxID=2602767 RepID=A0A5C7FJJ1_9BACT|nr:hypothetical protein [Neolewinella aurantiaca]TXF91436.1 hypothetical protein FUA23_01700 [Neolewinella aurantiaca]
MPRRYALIFISLLLVQFCAVYAWQRYERNEELTKLSASLSATNQAAIANQEEMLEMQIRSYEELMRDGSKARFAPLLHFVLKNYAAYDELTNDDNDNDFRKQALALIEAVSSDYVAMMTEHHLSMDLSEDDAKYKCGKIEDSAVISLDDLTVIPHQLPPALQRDMAQMITLDYLKDILLDAMSITCSRVYVFDQFFPLFMSDRCAYERGDSLNARVAIGSYSNALDPANVKLTVGGQELEIGLDGIAVFKAPAGKRGDHRLKTKVVVTNPLTGEVETGEGQFNYRVD